MKVKDWEELVESGDSPSIKAGVGIVPQSLGPRYPNKRVSTVQCLVDYMLTENGS